MKENQVIHIKCPKDGAKLAVKYFSGIEQHNVTCPVCHKTMPFSEFTLVTPEAEADNQFRVDDDPDTETTAGGAQSLIIGRLRRQGTAQTYQLKSGQNVIGRQAQSSKATIQLPTGEDRHMSREHLLIEVKREPKSGFHHYASLVRQECNATRINGTLIDWGDQIVLQHGDRIELPGNINLIFELPDGDETDV